MMIFTLVLVALVACVSAQDVKGIKSPPGNRNYFMPPSRRAVAYPVNDGKTIKKTFHNDFNYGKTQEPVKGYDPVKGQEPIKPYQEPVKGYEPQRPVIQKPVDHQAKGQKPEFSPVPQVPQAPSAPQAYQQPPQSPSDSDDQDSDGFDTPTQPTFNYDSPVDSDESLAPQPQPPSPPVPQSPILREPVPQSPILRSPSARKPYYQPQPQLPQSPQEPQQVYQPQEPQQPQQRYDVPLTYGRRPATTLLRTPTGFQLSPGLAAYPIY